MATEDRRGSEAEVEFASLFSASTRFATKTNTSARVKAERRAAMTEKQRTRGASGGRTLQINFRGSPSFKKLAMGLAGHMTAKTGKSVSLADVIEKAVYALAKAEGYRLEE